MSLPDWWPGWAIGERPEIITIVASGPSAKEAPLSLTKRAARVIAVNTSYKLVPWADAVFAADGQWWNYYSGAADFDGLKLTTDARAADVWGLTLVKAMRGDQRTLLETPGVIGWGPSGFMAFNLAMHFMPKRIALVGYDMSVGRGTHWHGDHPLPMHNPDLAAVMRWRKQMEDAGELAAKLGISVFNCSEHSELTRYKKKALEAVLNV